MTKVSKIGALHAGRAIAVAGTIMAAIAVRPGAVRAQTLYDGTMPGSGNSTALPDQQGWLAFGNLDISNPSVVASETYDSVNDLTSVNTSANLGIYAGYSNYSFGGSFVNSAFPVLNSATGFTLNFTVQNSSDPTEFNPSHPRSALSVILLNSNHTGVELGIRPNEIFSQAADFNSAAATDATTLGAALTNYSLTILGGTYTLSSGGTTLLTGATTQFTGATGPGALVYAENNFLFIGDDTTSDGGTYNVKFASITTNAATAPEPEALPLALLGAGIAVPAARRRLRRK